MKTIKDEKKETKPITKKDFEALGYACGEIKKCFENGWNKSLKNKPLEDEKKMPKRLKTYYDRDLNEGVVETYVYDIYYKEIFNSRYDDMIMNKINEILDYLESKGE